MTRWALVGLVGLLALAACSGPDDSDGVSEARECPDVTAGSLPGEEPVAHLAQHVWSSAPRPAEEDGRQSVIIRFRAGRVSAQAARVERVERTGGQVRRAFRTVPALAARVTEAERAALAADPNVEAIEPDVEWHALGVAVPQAANAPRPLGSVGEYTEGLRLVQAPAVWDADDDGALDVGTPTGEGIKVCVIDSGIDPDHPELKDRILKGHDFVDDDDDASDCYRDGSGACKTWGEGHGTHVAGTIAAQLGAHGTALGMDPGGVAGVAPGAQLLIARVLNLEGRARLSNVMAAVEWCQQEGARIASLSLGGGEWGETAQQSFQRVHDNGMLVIAAAGNDGGPLLYPAAFPSVLAVGAVDSHARLADFSCRGDNLGLEAPGVDVLSTFPEERGTYSEVLVGETRFDSRSAIFVPTSDFSGELVDCDYGSTRASCKGGTCGGFVAYVRLGGGKMETAVSNVIRQGARAVLLGHPLEGGDVETLVFGPGRWVPGAMVSHETGEALLKQKGTPVQVKVRPMDYARFSGTSMAAPHVSGVAALVWSARPSLTPTQVKDLLQSTARDLGDPGYDKETGHGLVQARAALDALSRMP